MLNKKSVISLIVGVTLVGVANFPDKINSNDNNTIYNLPSLKEIKVNVPEKTPKIEIKQPRYIIPIYNIPLEQGVQRYIYYKCKESGLSYELILALIKTESNFDTNLISHNSNGSYDSGLSQINSCRIKDLQKVYITNLLDPLENVDACIMILSELYQKYNDESMALVEYNMGEGNAKKLFKQGIYSSRYSREVIKNKEIILNTPSTKLEVF